MKLTFTARHFKAHDSLKDLAKNLSEKLNKIYDGVIGCDIILSYEKTVNSIKTAEVVVKANAHHTFTATERSDDFHISLENAFDKIESQLKKYKDKTSSTNGSKILSKIKSDI